MYPKTKTSIRLRQAVLAAFLAGVNAGVYAQPEALPANLKDVFDAAWARQPESQALLMRRDAVQAQRRAAAAWTPEPPALEISNKTDRLTRNDGARELEAGIAIPLWLPGERSNSGALADAQTAAVESRVEAARLRLAATVREACGIGNARASTPTSHVGNWTMLAASPPTLRGAPRPATWRRPTNTRPTVLWPQPKRPWRRPRQERRRRSSN